MTNPNYQLLMARHTVDTKFTCESVTKDKYGMTTVELQPVFATNGENKTFWDATPKGSISLTIREKESAAMFVPGNEYRVTFSTTIDPEIELLRGEDE